MPFEAIPVTHLLIQWDRHIRSVAGKERDCSHDRLCDKCSISYPHPFSSDPFDMADPDPVTTVETFIKGEAAKKRVLGLNAISIFEAKEPAQSIT